MSGDSEEKRLYLIRAGKVPKKCKSRPLLHKWCMLCADPHAHARTRTHAHARTRACAQAKIRLIKFSHDKK